MKITLVPPEHVFQVWPDIRGYLEPAVETSHGRWTLEHLLAVLYSGRSQLWIAFDDEGIWGALTTGARAVIVPHDTARNPEAMWHLLKQEKVTLLSQTPSMFRELVGQAAETSQSDLPDLRWIVFGGEALEPKHVQPWFDRYPDAST